MKKNLKRTVFVLISLVLVAGLYVYYGEWRSNTYKTELAALEQKVAACISDPLLDPPGCKQSLAQLKSRAEKMNSAEEKKYRRQLEALLIKAYTSYGLYEEVFPLLKLVAMDAPQESKPYQDLAQAYSLAGRERASLRYSRLSVQLAPDSWSAMARHAKLLDKFGYSEEAIHHLEKAMAIAPGTAQRDLVKALDEIHVRINSINIYE